MLEILKVLGANNAYNGIPSDVKDKLNQLPNVNSEQAQAGIVDYLLYIVGTVAVVMIIVAAVQMTTSAGDPGKVAKAKKTLLYAIIGLVVVVLAYAIAHFVMEKVV